MEEYYLMIMGESGELQIKKISLRESLEYAEKDGYVDPVRLNLMAGDKCLITKIKDQSDRYRLIKIL